jgi:hypothetical protein
MGVTSKAAANDRLAALKAELAKEVRLPDAKRRWWWMSGCWLPQPAGFDWDRA